MRRTLQNAPGSTIFLIFLLVMPSLGFGEDRLTGPAVGGVATEICFPLPDGERILKELEQGESCKEALGASEYLLKATEEIAKGQEERIVEQDKELQDARKLVEDTRKAGEQAAKMAAGPWYQRVLNAGKWIALGLIVGFVGGMGK